MKLSKLQKDHFEKQTHKSFWKKENIFNQMQAWYCHFILKGNDPEKACELAADQKGYPKP